MERNPAEMFLDQILAPHTDVDELATAMLYSNGIFQRLLAEKVLDSETATHFHLIDVMAKVPDLRAKAWERLLSQKPTDYVLIHHVASISGMSDSVIQELKERHPELQTPYPAASN